MNMGRRPQPKHYNTTTTPTNTTINKTRMRSWPAILARGTSFTPSRTLRSPIELCREFHGCRGAGTRRDPLVTVTVVVFSVVPPKNFPGCRRYHQAIAKHLAKIPAMGNSVVPAVDKISAREFADCLSRYPACIETISVSKGGMPSAGQDLAATL